MNEEKRKRIQRPSYASGSKPALKDKKSGARKKVLRVKVRQNRIISCGGCELKKKGEG